ncbi:GNAT family N-acetyltransferase [Nonomuraea typhae]|uniref:GNAT family N-acetyltransferase n=1 Tax=Nonomuraea typhae TaxID=2603600 RepID=UPI0012F863AB|nr:GNAT family N-acetyltransferase [Nonomuraea typhae]
MPEIVRLTDGVVTLTPLSMEDVDAHLAGEDEHLVRWLNGGPGTRATVEKHVRRCMEQWASGGSVHAFGVRAGARETLAGTMEVHFHQPYLAPGQVNLAYGLYPAWRGRGIATRAVTLACRHARSAGAAEAVITVDPENLASANVARRSGFAYLKRAKAGDDDLLDWYVRTLTATRGEVSDRPGRP